MKLLIDIFGFLSCTVIGFIGGYLFKKSQEINDDNKTEENIVDTKNITYNEGPLFFYLKKSNEKLGFIFGVPGAGNGFVYKNEIFETLVKTKDLIFTIDCGDSSCLVKKLGGISLNESEVEAELERANNYKLINFNIHKYDTQIMETVLEYINKRAKNEPTTILIRYFNGIASNPVLFAKFKDLFEQNNVSAIIEDSDFEDLYENKDFVEFMNKSKNFILLSQPPMARKSLKEKFEISDELLENISCVEPGKGLIIHDGIIEKYHVKTDTTSPLYLLYTTRPDEI